MLEPLPAGEDFAEVRSLNRLFVDFLADRARRGAHCMGLDRSAASALRAAEPRSLETLAAFPRALFQVLVPRGGVPRIADMRVDTVDVSHYVLQVTILHSAWTLSRRNPYLARLLLGLEDRDVRELRTLDLADIPAHCAASETVVCAFAQHAWLWPKLLTESRPEARRQLLLLALQPRIDPHNSTSQLLARKASA
jgi:hypothetical protein